MTPEPEDNRLDQQLRSKFEHYAPPPTDKLWPGIAPNIGPPPTLRQRRRPLPLPLLFGLTALLAGLVGWLLPHGAARPAAGSIARVDAVQPRKAGTSAAGVAASTSEAAGLHSPKSSSVEVSPSLGAGTTGVDAQSGKLNSNQSKPANRVATPRGSFGNAVVMVAAPTNKKLRSNNYSQNHYTEQMPDNSLTVNPATTPPAPVATPDSSAASAADATPATLRALAALERQTLVQLPSTATLAAGPLEAAGRTSFIGTLRRERAELLRLQRRTDSLLLALGDLPAVPAMAAHPDSTQPETQYQKPETHKWSLLLTAAPEQNALTLQGPEGDSLTALRRNHETGRAGFSANALAEYRLTPRLSVGGGVGYTTFGADLRITNKTTDVQVTYHTTTTTNTAVFTSVNQTHSIRIIQVPQLSPIFNSSGQVIRYDTVYVPRQDTVYSTTIQHDTVRTTNRVTTPSISKKETLTTKLLQPNYRFFTVPVLLRYRLTAPGTSRLWTDVALGAQLQFFLGGTQVVTEDGENFRTEKITVGSSPFRALNVALSGSLALNYALTPRLSVSVAPSMRWQALSLYKPETGLRQQPTATGLLFGVRFGL